MASTLRPAASAVEIDPQTAAEELEQRRGHLVFWTLAASIMSLVATVKFGTIFWPRPIGWWPAILLAVTFGSFIGLAQAPLLGRLIANKRFWLALPSVYAVAAVAGVVALQTGELIWGLVVLTLAPPLLAIATKLLPSVPLGRRDRCFSCGYNVGGFASEICPECGAPLPAPPAPAVVPPVAVPQNGRS